jgi:hypothetical protein
MIDLFREKSIADGYGYFMSLGKVRVHPYPYL